MANASTADGANVQQWPANGHPTQQWFVEDLGNGEYHIQNENSGKLLEVTNADTSDGANIQQYAATGSDCQRWRIVDDGGQYALEAVHSGKSPTSRTGRRLTGRTSCSGPTPAVPTSAGRSSRSETDRS